MLNPNRLLQYWFDATCFGGGGEVEFDTSTPLWELDAQQMLSGLLDSNLTREVLRKYEEQCADTTFGDRPVPVVICARWFVPSDGTERMPLLLIPGLLDVGGTLQPNPQMRPWIPWQRLAHDGTATEQPMVCTLDALRAHQVTMGDLPDDGTWRTTAERALTLFDALCGIDDDPSSGGQVTADSLMLRIWDCPDSHVSTASMLHALRSTLEEKGEQFVTRPLRALLGISTQSNAVRRANELPDDTMLQPKLLCGIVDGTCRLSMGDRNVLLEFGSQQAGDSLVVHAAEGTHASAVALSAMANHLTESALRGERVPSMALFASSDTLARIASALAQRPPVGQTALPSRWLPRISQDATQPETRRVLGPIPSVAMCYRPCSGYHGGVQAFEFVSGHPFMGDGARYCDEWYLPRALTYYLDCVSSYMGRRIREVVDAARLLSERLRRVDQDRCELVDAYANVCHASELMRERDALLQQIIGLRNDHRATRAGFDRWNKLAMQFAEQSRPQKRAKATGKEMSEEEFISKHIRIGETIPQGKTSLAEVCEAYRVEIGRIESQIIRLREESTEVNRRVRSFASEGQRCAQTITLLQHSCGLTQQQIKSLESTIDGREVSIGQLDDVLDQTVRPAEFWLAVHIYEAHWLSMAQREGSLQRALKKGGVIAWRALSNLCPINLIPAELASAFVLEARGKLAQTPIPPLDLAVILDADCMDVASGAAVLGNASRVLAFGTEASLGPNQPQGRVSDALYASKVVREEWEDVKSKFLSMSGASSLARALFARLGGSEVFLHEVDGAYGELVDLRSELRPTEQLRSIRMPSNSADDPAYPLLGIIPALSHVLVPDSAWKQVGPSRTNRAEVLAIARWLNRHGRQICDRYDSATQACIAVISAYKEQAGLLKEHLRSLTGLPPEALVVTTLREAKGRSWPMVVASATCGPTAYEDDCACTASDVLSLMAACAQDALLLFWGGTWLKSDDAAALTYVRRAAMVGRLYSVVRERKKDAATQQESPKHLTPGTRLPMNLDLRAKPMSLTSLLKELVEHGDLPALPSTSKMNLALEQVGLIERVGDEGVQKGWRPTPAGREIGILTTTDRKGNPFCSYAPSTKAVVLSTALTVLGV